MVFNSTFNNISAISWWLVVLVEETGGPRENHWPAASLWQTLLHNVVSSTPRLYYWKVIFNTFIEGTILFHIFTITHPICSDCFHFRCYSAHVQRIYIYIIHLQIAFYQCSIRFENYLNMKYIKKLSNR